MTNADAIELVKRCLEGCGASRELFQKKYGAIIYGYYRKLLRGNGLEGDVYLYTFKRDRVFKRLKSFCGHNISFQNYLKYYVLKSLFFEWLRSVENTEVNSVEFNDEINYQIEPTQGNFNKNCTILDESSLSEKEALVIKLLYLYDCDLEAKDIRLLAKIAGKPISEIVYNINEIWQKLYIKNMQKNKYLNQLSNIYFHILRYQQEIELLRTKIEGIEATSQVDYRKTIQKDISVLEDKLSWRYTQQEKIVKEYKGHIIKTEYKDLAFLLNWPLGTVCTQISRARKALKESLLAED
jgi:hypothetical protein